MRRKRVKMREYEIVIVYDLAVNEAGGSDASIEHLKAAVERNGGQSQQILH